MEKCFFKNHDGSCGAMSTYCNNDYEHCNFYKSEHDYIIQINNAIALNRKKGNCKNCKYVMYPCDFLQEKPKEII